MPVNPLDVTNGWQLAALLIIALPGVVAAVLSLRNSNKIDVNNSKIADVHTVINSRLTELVNATRAASKAEGIIEGTATEKARADAEGAAQLKRQI